MYLVQIDLGRNVLFVFLEPHILGILEYQIIRKGNTWVGLEDIQKIDN